MSMTRKSTDGFAFQVMLVLCVIWGMQQVLIKWAAPDIAPIMQAAGRSAIAALIVGVALCWQGSLNKISSTWRAGRWRGRCSVWSFCSSPRGFP
jgi:drug/metabolite transporter (DMT)-like permease